MIDLRILVLGTGGTIAGAAGSATGGTYRAGGLGAGRRCWNRLAALGLDAQLGAAGKIARLGSQEYRPGPQWQALQCACAAANGRSGGSPASSSNTAPITAEETAFTAQT